MLKNKLYLGTLLLSLALIASFSPGPAAAEAAAKVTKIAVNGDQVVITGDGTLTGYPYVLENPARVVVDIRNADLAGSARRKLKGGGLIEKVEAGATAANQTVRVTVYLAQEASYELAPLDNGLSLTLQRAGDSEETPMATIGAGLAPNLTLPKLKAPAEKKAQNQSGKPNAADLNPRGREDNLPLPPPTSPAPPKTDAEAPIEKTDQDLSEKEWGPVINPTDSAWAPVAVGQGAEAATTLLDLYSRTVIRGFQVLIHTDGVVTNFVDYELDKPGRLVLEFPCLNACFDAKDFPFRFHGVKNVKVEETCGMVRVTFLMDREWQVDRWYPPWQNTFMPYDIKRTYAGVVVSFFDHNYVRGGGKYIPGGFDYMTHVTGHGETLCRLAQTYYNDPAAWIRLYSANRYAFVGNEAGCMDKRCGAIVLGEALYLRVPKR